MSVQVSYKKQTTLGLIGLLMLFLIIEIIANVWWSTQVNCEFENNEIFSQMDAEKKRQLCVDLYEIKTSGMQLIPNQASQTITINNLGFRGDEFSIDKPDSTFRIFLLGGSTMFGHGATSDSTTIPGYLQSFFDISEEKYELEIINAGIQGADSYTELNLLKNKIINYSPNLVIIYDGWNDLRAQNSSKEISTNWNLMCDFGKNQNFDVMIMLQPIAGFGNKDLTLQELEYAKTGIDYNNTPLIESFEKYLNYASELEKLEKCTSVSDLRDVFDNVTTPIYWDQGHVSDNGNKIVANQMNEIILNYLPENIVTSSIQLNDDKIKTNENPILNDQFRYILSSYKTPIMLTSIFSFEQHSETSIQNNTDVVSDDIPKIFQDTNLTFETQSIPYENTNISILIEITNENNSENKLLEIKTLDKSNNSSIQNVTYFIKILNNGNNILSDYFFSSEEQLPILIKSNEKEVVEIQGNRQYDHNALIADVSSPIIISGPILNEQNSYTFEIEIRTMYEKSNWVFSLTDFSVDITI